jgi:hypothetical protein
MTLTLVTGRPNAGKTGHLYGPAIEAAVAGLSPVILLPSMPDARRAAEEFAGRGATGVRTTVLDRWIAELWSLHGDGRRIVEPGVREILLRRACEKATLRALVHSAGTPGFVRLLASVAERVPELGQARPRSTEDREFLDVLERYDRVLAVEGLVELAVASRLLGTSPPPVGGPVAVNRFTDLSAAQEVFVCGLAGIADVSVALPWEEGHPATEALTPLVDRLAELGRHVHVGTVESAGELPALEGALYRPERPHAATGAVVFGEAAGEDLEAVLAVDLAAERIAGGTEPERVVIAFRNAAARAPLIEAAAAQAGIDVDVDVALPLTDVPMGRALTALLDAAAGRDPSRERLLAYLGSPYSGVSAAELERVDTAWRRARASGHRLLDDASRLAGPGSAIRYARAVTAAPLTRRNSRKWKSLLDSLLACADERRGLGHAEGFWDCAVHREALRTVASLAEGVAGGVGEPEVRAVLAGASVSPGGPERADAVLFTEAHRVRSRRFDVVILGGLTAAEFSSERPRPIGAELLDRLGLPSGTDERASERLLFYTIVTRPRERLYLLRQATDASGLAVRPSVFWEEVLDLYRGSDTAELERHPEGVPLIRRPLTALASASVAYTAGRRASRSGAQSAPWRPRRGMLLSEQVRAEIGSREEFSVSELEAYAACPYRWFFDRAISPREIDAAFEAREAGSIAHEVLAAFYARWSPPDAPRRVTPADLPEALGVLDRTLEEVLSMIPDTIGLAEDLTVEQVKRWTRAAIEDDALLLPGYLPVAHEFAFGGSEERPFEFGGVALRGRVDRIDMRGDGVVVSDYKSSGTVAGHGSFETRGIMQLPVYLAATTTLLGREPDGAVFRSLRSRSVRGFWRGDRLSLLECGSRADAVGPDEVSAILESAALRVAAAAEGIRAGDIAPRRGGCGGCGFCAARSVCGEVVAE